MSLLARLRTSCTCGCNQSQQLGHGEKLL